MKLVSIGRIHTQFYEFVRALSPRPGSWQMSIERHGNRDKTHIYVLQSLPFGFSRRGATGWAKEWWDLLRDLPQS